MHAKVVKKSGASGRIGVSDNHPNRISFKWTITRKSLTVQRDNWPRWSKRGDPPTRAGKGALSIAQIEGHVREVVRQIGYAGVEPLFEWDGVTTPAVQLPGRCGGGAYTTNAYECVDHQCLWQNELHAGLLCGLCVSERPSAAGRAVWVRAGGGDGRVGPALSPGRD